MKTKQVIRITESELKNMISNAVSSIVSEKIDIDPENKGKFTKTQKETGKSTEELCHSKNPLTRKRANFAKMAKRHFKPLDEAESEGWIVDSSEAQEAYNLAVQELGEETINNAIIRCMSDETLAQCLAYIFRQYDFREWKSKFE